MSLTPNLFWFNPSPMKIPTISGLIRRRILLNYRIAPEVIAALLPPRFQPKIIHGHAMAGICLIRLEEVRPFGLPKFLGINSENSAHRIAVTWTDDEGRPGEGVYIPRRDTSSALNAFAGGRIFPGVHHHSHFTTSEKDRRITIRVKARDQDEPLVDIAVRECAEFPADSMFSSLADSSAFFEAGDTGYSLGADGKTLDGLLLDLPDWKVSPLEVEKVHSSYFDDPEKFPLGKIHFDHALLMRDRQHQWHSRPSLAAS